METVVLIKEYEIHFVSSSGDRVFWWRRWYSSKSTKFIWYLLVEIESSGGDGGTHLYNSKKGLQEEELGRVLFE